ncbi:glycosyltransferase family 2 protein [Ferruginibacter sp.]
MDQPFISICIPAYKRIDFLERLFQSIIGQSFRDYEVVVTDDSPGTEVEELSMKYKDRFPALTYKRNGNALGTPSNWNEAVLHAKGKWIKIMHDDDWFEGVDALGVFAKATTVSNADLFFSAYYDVFLKDGTRKLITPTPMRYRQLRKEPVTLLSRNIIGPPSVLLYRNDGKHPYDPALKWLVDIDMYVRRLRDDKIHHLPDAIINVGVGQYQVTASVHGNPSVEIPEHFYFLGKTGMKPVRNILVYDYWWRFFRNFNLKNKEAIRKYGQQIEVHDVFFSMMNWQKMIPRFLLKFGPFSKAVMWIHFISNRHRIK